jgi:hypothetical protein
MLIDTDRIREVRTVNENGHITVRLGMDDGTWLELGAKGSVHNYVRFDGQPAEHRRSFDFKQEEQPV